MCGCNKNKGPSVTYTYTSQDGSKTTTYKTLAEAQAAVIRGGGKYTKTTTR